MTNEQATIICGAKYDLTGNEIALLTLINNLKERLDQAESRIQTLIDSTGTWRDHR